MNFIIIFLIGLNVILDISFKVSFFFFFFIFFWNITLLNLLSK